MNKPLMEIEVDQGAMFVESVELWRMGEHVWYGYIELRDKRPILLTAGAVDDEPPTAELVFAKRGSSVDSLATDAPFTIVRIRTGQKVWRIIADEQIGYGCSFAMFTAHPYHNDQRPDATWRSHEQR